MYCRTRHVLKIDYRRRVLCTSVTDACFSESISLMSAVANVVGGAGGVMR